MFVEQGRIHSYPSRVRVGRSGAGEDHQRIWAGAGGSKSSIRPDTRLPQSHTGGQEQCCRKSLGHLGRSCMLKKLKNAEKVNSRKSVRWSAVPQPCLSKLLMKLRGEQGSGPEGVDDLCFHTYGRFCPSPPPPPSLPLKSQSGGLNSSLEPQIRVSRPKSQP